jgi:hypothetical protein
LLSPPPDREAHDHLGNRRRPDQTAASTARNAGLAGHGGVHQASTDGPDADSSARDFICQRVRAVQEGTSASRIIERLVKEYLSKKEGK